MRGLGDRIVAGYKAGRTRHLNQLRHRAFEQLRMDAIADGWLLPNILAHPEGGVELSYERGYGERFLRFRNQAEALDFVLSLFCCC